MNAVTVLICSRGRDTTGAGIVRGSVQEDESGAGLRWIKVRISGGHGNVEVFGIPALREANVVVEELAEFIDGGRESPFVFRGNVALCGERHWR